MKLSKKILTVLILVSIVAFTAVEASAAFAWRSGTVVETGLSDTGDYTVLFERNNGKQQTFVIPDAQLNRILSLALAAVASGLQCRAYVYWIQAIGDTIEGLLIIKTGN